MEMDNIYNLFKKLSVQEVDLTGKRALITGGNEGIGYHTAIFLAKMHCAVTIVSRNAERSARAVEEIKNITGNSNIDYDSLDLGSFDSVRGFAKKFSENHDKLDLLINNAGCTFHEFGTTVDGFEKTVHVNHLGPMLLTLLLLPIVKKAENPRIIFLSSRLHLHAKLTLPDDLHQTADNYSAVTLYNRTKLMNVLCMKELTRKLADTNIIVSAVHPGLVVTNLAYNNLPDSLYKYFVRAVVAVLHFFLARTGEQGAMTSVYAATSPNIVTGAYYDSCAVGRVNPLANDVDLARDLWAQSLKMIHFDDTGIYN